MKDFTHVDCYACDPVGHSSPPPHGSALAELALPLSGFGLGTGEFASLGLLPNVGRDVHVTVPIAGHTISAYALGMVIGAPLLAAAFARAGRRAMLIGLMVFFALANLLCAAASSYHLIVSVRFLAGLPHGAYFGIASLVAASLVPPDKRAQAVARMMLGLSSANVVGVPFATWVGQAAGWRAAFVVVAAIGWPPRSCAASRWILLQHRTARAHLQNLARSSVGRSG